VSKLRDDLNIISLILFRFALPAMILQETVNRRQQAFRKTEQEIEARLAEEQEEEQRHEEQYNSNKQQENHTGNTSCRESGMFRLTTQPYVAAVQLSVTS